MRIAICEDEPYMVEDLRGRLQRYASERGCFLQVSEFQEGEALLAEDEEFQNMRCRPLKWMRHITC